MQAAKYPPAVRLAILLAAALLSWALVLAPVRAGPPIFPVPSDTSSLATTLSGRLRAAQSLANSPNANVFNNAPYLIPTAYSNSLAVARSQVISANGNWYVVVTAGTTAASGSGPSSTQGVAITDGTAQFAYVSSPQIAASDSAAPTLAVSSTDPASTDTTNYGSSYLPQIYPSSCALFGAYAVYDAAKRLAPAGFQASSGNPAYIGGRRIECMSDGARVRISAAGSNASTAWRVAVDQFDGRGPRFLTPGGIIFKTAASDSTLSAPYLTIDWSSVGGRRTRKYIIYLSPQSYDVFGGIATDSASQVWAPTPASNLSAAIITDSLGAGSGNGPWLPGADIASRLSASLGVPDVRLFATGGTGEISPGSGPYYTFAQRVPEALSLNPSVFAIMGSPNDKSYTASAISAAVSATMQAIRAGSRAPIIRVGVWPLTNDATLATDETAVKAGYDAFASSDALTHCWVPLSTASLPWITWPFNNSGTPFSSNNQRYLGGDGHPTEGGTAFEARKLSEGISACLGAIQ